MYWKYLLYLLEHKWKQEQKWGEQNHHPQYWMVILMEEVGEAAHALCGKHYDYKNYREELIQVAAVAIAAIESFDRTAGKDGE